LLKLAGQRDGLVYERRFNTIVTRDFVLAVLQGEISDAAHAAAWLDQHRSTADPVIY
jgi:hypothetical protein